MRLFQIPFTATGKWVSGIMIVSVLAATTSCTSIGTVGDPSNVFGLFINNDTSSDLLGGIRSRTGEKLSLFGTFKSDGNIKEIEEIEYEDAQGNTTSLQFAAGRPVKAVLADGSAVDVTYDDTATNRLKGTVMVTPAGGEPYQAVAFDVDLNAAMNQLAQTVSDLTQGRIDLSASSGATSATARLINPDGTAGKTSESRQESIIVAAIFTATIAATGFLIVCCMTQMMQAMCYAMADAVAQATVVVIFMPLILMGEMCRLVVLDPVINIDVNVYPDYLPHRHHWH